MEQEIIKIIERLIYSDILNDLYNKKSTKIDFPIKMKLEPNFKVLADFNDEYFIKYQNILIENATIYALNNHENEYLYYLKENLNNFRKAIDNEFMFRIKISEYAIKNIINKYFHNHNVDDEIKNKYKHLFESIHNSFITITPSINVYRNIIETFLKYTEDKEEILDVFLNSNRINEQVIKLSNNVLNSTNVNTFKKIAIRIILSDVYIHLVSQKIKTELDDNINDLYYQYHDEEENIYYKSDENIDEYNEEEIDEYNNQIEDNILEHISNCVNNDEYFLPTDFHIRMNILSKFIMYNMYNDKNAREYDIETIESEKDKKYILKKINPLYRFDLVDIEN